MNEERQKILHSLIFPAILVLIMWIVKLIEITFKNTPGTLKVMIYTSSGQIIVNRIYKEYIGRTLKISDLQNNHQGIYFITLVTSGGRYTYKVIKLNN